MRFQDKRKEKVYGKKYKENNNNITLEQPHNVSAACSLAGLVDQLIPLISHAHKITRIAMCTTLVTSTAQPITFRYMPNPNERHVA